MKSWMTIGFEMFLKYKIKKSRIYVTLLFIYVFIFLLTLPISKERGFLLPTNINIEILKYKNAIVTPAYGRM